MRKCKFIYFTIYEKCDAIDRCFLTVPSHGTRSWAICHYNDKILKLYGGKYVYDSPISYIHELDIVMRVRNPSIVRGYQIITRDYYPMLNHGIILEYVHCSYSDRTFLENLKVSLDKAIVNNILLRNDLIHTDTGHNNECYDRENYKIIDFNGDTFRYFRDSRASPKYEWIFVYGIIANGLGIVNLKKFYDYHNGKGPRPELETKYLLTVLQRDLLYDFLLRLFEPKIDRILSLEEIPHHPLFTVHKIKYELEYEEFSPLVEFTPNFDYFAAWRKVIDSFHFEEYDIIDFFTALDIYLRYLPYFSENNAETVVWSCLQIVGRNNLSSDIFEDVEVMDDIIRKLNGKLFRRFLQHQALSENDLRICWHLFCAPYQDYIKINPDRFPEIVELVYDYSPGGPVVDFLQEAHPLIVKSSSIANKLKSKAKTKNHGILFTKLTKEELTEFLELYDIHIDEDGRFYSADVAERIFRYSLAQLMTKEYSLVHFDLIKITPAVEDLLHSSTLTLEIKRQFTLEDMTKKYSQKVLIFHLKKGYWKKLFEYYACIISSKFIKILMKKSLVYYYNILILTKNSYMKVTFSVIYHDRNESHPQLPHLCFLKLSSKSKYFSNRKISLLSSSI